MDPHKPFHDYNGGIMGSHNKLGKQLSMENNRWCSTMDPEGKEIQYCSRKARKDRERECCMCGDVGFQESLFRCYRCHDRFQHIYCGRLYSDQLKLDGVDVCDWCLDIQDKQKIQSHKRKIELQEMEGRRTKKVADGETVSRSASTSATKQHVSVSIGNPTKANGKPTLILHVKSEGSKQNHPSSRPEDRKLSRESCPNLPCISTRRRLRKGGLGRRFKLLSDVLWS